MAQEHRSIVIAASACLLGQALRYNGGHKRHDYLCQVLAKRFAIIPVCPEVELGLPVPRETLERVNIDGDLRLRGTQSGNDHSAAMNEYARKCVAELSSLGICGYVLKARSPSCALAETRGAFTEILLGQLPALPVIDEDQLDQPGQALSFVERVVTYHRLAKPR